MKIVFVALLIFISSFSFAQNSGYLKIGGQSRPDTTTPNVGLTSLYQNSLKTSLVQNAAKQDSLNWYQPEKYGAARDGSTDDAPAWNAMIAAMPDGAIVNASAGIYQFNSTVYITKRIKIIGAGQGTAFKCGVNNIDMFKISADYVIMRDFFMYNSFTPTSGAAIKIDSSVAHPGAVAKFTIENVAINQYYNAIDAVNAYGWTIINCQISFINYAVRVSAPLLPDAGDSHISGCYFSPRGGFTGNTAIYQSTSGGLRIVNNKFNYNSTQRYSYGYYADISGTSDLIIAGNSFENYTVNAIKIVSHPAYRFSNVSITGNQFAAINASAKANIAIDTLDNFSITGNVFTKFAGSSDTAITVRSGNYGLIDNSYSTYGYNVMYYGTNSGNKGDGAAQCTNSDKGTATLIGGTVTVSNSMVRTGSKIYVTVVTPGGTQGFLSVPTITNGTSFVINSTSASETSTVNYRIEN